MGYFQRGLRLIGWATTSCLVGCSSAPQEERAIGMVSQAWVACSAGNNCYVAEGDRATLGPDGDPDNDIIGCATESASLPGLDLIGCFVCDNGAWSTCASGLVPCGTTNQCYVTASGKATLGPDGDPNHDPAGCAPGGISYPGLDDQGCFQCVQEAWSTCSAGKIAVAENFDAVPFWSSSIDASWGSEATWSIGADGQTGDYLKATRSSPGSSTKVKVYAVTPNADYTISIYMRGASSAADYWVESGYRLGNYSAADFDSNPGAWKFIKKFSPGGTNGNGNTWVKYTKSFNTGSNNQISVGVKAGNLGGTMPTARWDTLRIK